MSLIISHRGNIEGPVLETENKPEQIDFVLKKNFDVEVDLWYDKNIFFLGHDSPQYKIDYNWLKSRKNKLWIHCKNLQALEQLINTDLNFFWHQEDDFAITSKGYIWTYPGKKLGLKSIAVMPEGSSWQLHNLKECFAICSDYVYHYQGISNLYYE